MPALDYLYQEAQDLLSRDRGKFANLSYPVYPGRTTTPMSTLTQRARGLREEYGAKPAPYNNKIQSVLGRNNEGITLDNIQSLLNDLSGSQRNFAQNAVTNTLQNRLGHAFIPRVGNFNNSLGSDIDAIAPEVQSGLSNIASINRNLEGSRNRNIVNTLQGLQQDKLARRQALIANLEQFGAQKHAHSNIVNAANRGMFENEARAPYQKMAMLENAIANAGRGSSSDEMGGIEGPGSADLARAIKAYNTVSQPYKGQLVSPLPPEILATHNILERLHPSLKDENYNTRKRLTGELINNETVAGRALSNLPAAMQGQISMLERQAKERLERDLEGINGQYIKLNQYGSRQHMKEAERRAREINQATLEQRSKILQESLKNQLHNQHENDITNINQLAQIGNQGQRNFTNTIAGLRDLNQQGAQKFENQQGENEELYRNYQNENMWQWPHMRAQAKNEAVNNIFSGLADRNISLDNLAALNTRYSEIEKELGGARQELLSAQQARDALAAQLGLQRQQEAQRQAEWQRQQQAQQQAVANERARLAQIQQTANPYEHLNYTERLFRDKAFRDEQEHGIWGRSQSLSSVPPSMRDINNAREAAMRQGLYSDPWRRYAESLQAQYW